MKVFFNTTIMSGLVIQILIIGFLFPASSVLAEEGSLCALDADVAMVLDVSGSMEEGGSPSQCEWQVRELFEGTQQCRPYSESGLTEQECQAKPTCTIYSPIYTPPVPSKIESAKNAAKSFLDNLKSQDQSALVVFSDIAQLTKQLSFNHQDTALAIDAAPTGGYTNIGDAIAEAVSELGSERGNPQATKTIILLTDGKANRPNGSGDGEEPLDVAYAEQKAQEAADLGYKIFTIGLGDDVNSEMLSDIANITGGSYYPAPSGDGLADIYAQISQEMCQYGSISGCKYNDLNNNREINDEEETLSGWDIVLSGDASSSQPTDQNGCYTFAGLMAGEYVVSETSQEGWVQTFPDSSSYSVTLSQGENLIDYNFANYFPIQEPEPQPEDFDNEEECREAGFHWYDQACHRDPQPGQTILPQPGYVVINEIMQNPATVPDTHGEWFELYNTTNYDIDLSGCVIRDTAINLHTITSLIIPAHSYPVLARNGDINLNGGLTPNYVYSNTTLNNTADSIILECNSIEIDRVAYDGGPQFPNPTGASMILGNPGYDNNVGSNWCISTTPWLGGAGDLGSPGALNDSCGFAPVCGNNVQEQGEQCDDGNTANGDGCSATCQTEQQEEPQPEDFNNEQECTSAGFYWYDGACHRDLQPQGPICGNSAVEQDEQCDDGNTASGDGCSATCQVEQIGGGGGGGGGGIPFYFTINASSGEGGSISPSGPVSVAYLSDQAFAINPNIAYKITDVLIDGVSAGAVMSYNFSNVSNDHTISAVFAVAKIGDINRDAKVDEQDFALMIAAWGQIGLSNPADLNNDEKVDEYDLAILMLHWGE